jgi:hypothetical protein
MNSKLRHLWLRAAMLVWILLMAVTLCQALDDVPSLRCGVETVFVGDSQYEVREACGQPQKIDASSGESVEAWIYNFGPSEFIYYLTFVNGRLERIQAGGYGFEKP